MLIRSLVSIFIVAASFVFVCGQTPETTKDEGDKSVKPTSQVQTESSRDMPFSNGVDLQFLIKELAGDIHINVVFDPESFRKPGRKTSVYLKNVTAEEALSFVFVKERLFAQDVGPKEIMVMSQDRANKATPYFGLSFKPLSDKQAQYLGAKAGTLVASVRADSPGSKAGFKAGDVITTIDNEPFRGALSLIRNFKDETKSEIKLKIVRDKQEQTITLPRDNGIK